jgi:ferredoxin
MRLQVDPTACAGHGLCADLLPELIELDEWGYPKLPADTVHDRLLRHARRARGTSLNLALRLVKTPRR